jgi:hypothetical protein
MVAEKNRAYGDSLPKAAATLALLYPTGVQPQQYLDFIHAARIVEKLSRVAQGADPHGESPYLDIAGQATVALHQAAQQKENHESWPGCVSDQDAVKTSPGAGNHDSAASVASASTTTIAKPASDAMSSPRPSGYSASTLESASTSESSAPAQSVTAAAKRREAVRVGKANNRLSKCAACGVLSTNLCGSMTFYRFFLSHGFNYVPYFCDNTSCEYAFWERVS